MYSLSLWGSIDMQISQDTHLHPSADDTACHVYSDYTMPRL